MRRFLVLVAVMCACTNSALAETPPKTPDTISGTTVITHGFTISGPVPDWPYFMAAAIRGRSPGALIYKYNKVTGNLDDCTHLACGTQGTGGETIIVFDWAEDSRESGAGFSEAAAEALVAALLQGSPEKVNLDHLHLIGHSRGAVVNSEVAERLIAIGFTPEQVTTLDPHDGGLLQKGTRWSFEDYDVNSEHADDYNCGPGEPEAGVCSWDGVGYHDNYWRDRGIWSVCSSGLWPNDPDGREIPGAADLDGTGIEDFCHSDPHYWYYFTIDSETQVHPDPNPGTDDDPEPPIEPGLDWFNQGPFNCGDMSSMARDEDGFNASRIGGVSRRCLDDPENKQPVLFDFNLNEGFVNGNFEKEGSIGGVAGWEFHGGGGTAGIDIFLDHELDLDPGEWRMHNRFYLPVGTTGIYFCRRITDAGNGEEFVVQLLQESGLRELHSEFVTSTDGEHCESYPVELFEQGKISQLMFMLSDNGSGVEVRVDDVRLVVGTQILEVTKTGSGSGSVISDPEGINCGTACSYNFLNNELVTLVAAPEAGSVFSGWGGDCTGTGACVVTMDQFRSVDVVFNNQEPVLTVTKTGSGTGLITSTPSGIDCGTACSAGFPLGSQVTLQAQPLAGSSFAGWSGGGCSGTSPCIVLMTTDINVTATFNGRSAISGAASPNPQNINLPMTFDVTITDGSGNPPPPGTSVLFSTIYPGWFSGTVPQGSVSPVSVGTDAGGSVSVNFTSEIPGSGNMTVTSMDVSTLVPFQFDDPSADIHVRVSVGFHSGGASYSKYDIGAQVTYSDGSPVPYQDVTFEFSPSNVGSWDDYDNCDTSAGGSCDVVLTITQEADVMVIATAGQAVGSTTFHAYIGDPGGVELTPVQTFSLTWDVYGVDFSPDGNTLVAAGEYRDLRAWNTSDWSQKWAVTTSETRIYQVSISPDNSYVAVAGDDAVEIRDLTDGSFYCIAENPDDEALLVHWTSSSSIASTSYDRAFRHTSICGTGIPYPPLPSGHMFEEPAHLDFFDSGGGTGLIAACTDEGDIFVWNTSGALVHQDNVASGSPALDTDFSSDGTRLAAVGYGAVKVFNTSGWSSTSYPAQALDGRHYGLTYIDNDTKLAVGGDNKIEIINLADSSSFAVANVVGSAFEMAWNPSTEELAVGTELEKVYIFRPLEPPEPPDVLPPLINVTYPSDGAVTNTPTITTTGLVTDGSSVSEFTIDGITVPLDAEGYFTHEVSLAEGPNTITYWAIDPGDHEATVTRSITLQVDHTAPVISGTSVAPPAGMPGTMFAIETTVVDGDTGVENVVADIRDPGGSVIVVLPMSNTGGNLFVGFFDSTAAGFGFYTVDITAVDSSPQANSRTVTSAAVFSVVESINNDPNTPTVPYPADGSTDVALGVSLTWSGGDPDADDIVTYDVYLEPRDQTPDALVCNDVGVTQCDLLGDLAAGELFYWYVVARDNHEATATSETWEFTTAIDSAVIFWDGFESGNPGSWSSVVGYGSSTSAIYEEDFSSDPGFTTSEPGDLYWDSANQWYFVRVYDVSSGYGNYFAESPSFEPTGSSDFHTEFDIDVADEDWGNYPGVFFTNSQLADPWTEIPWFFQFIYADSTPRKFGLKSDGIASAYYSGTVAEGVWYHVSMDYDSLSQTVDLTVTNRSSGAVFWSLVDQPFEIIQSFDTVTLGHRTAPPEYGSSSIIYVDNILIEGETEPPSFSDDFNRTDNEEVGNGWTEGYHSGVTTTPSIASGQLLFNSVGWGGEDLYRDFVEGVNSWEVDFVPVSQSAADHVSFNAVTTFHNAADDELGRIIFYHHDTSYACGENTTTQYCSETSANPAFDNVARHFTIPVQQILQNNLTGVVPAEISYTRIRLYNHSGWNGNYANATADNVVVNF